MSAQIEKGDQVRCIETWTTSVLETGDERKVDEVSPGGQLFVQGEWVPARYFEKIEPKDPRITAWERVATHPIFEGSKVVDGPFIDAVIARLDELLQIAYVMPGDADADDAYVEPEPLKEGDWVQVWAQVNQLADSDGDLLLVSTAFGEAAPVSTTFYARNDAIVRPADGAVPPWVKPAQVLTDDERDRIMLAYRDGVLAPGQAVLIEVEDIIRERTKGCAS